MSEEPVVHTFDRHANVLSYIVIDDSHFEKFIEESDPPSLVMGFAGPGLIAQISVMEIIDQLSMTQIGHVHSRAMPPISIFLGGVLQYPFRIFWSKEKNLFAIICEVPFPENVYGDLSRTIMGWAEQVGIRDVIIIHAQESKILEEIQNPTISGAGEEEIVIKLERINVPRYKQNAIIGPEAAMINECLNGPLDAIVLICPCIPQMPSPQGSIKVLEIIKQLLGLESVNSDRLIEAADDIKAQMEQLAQKVQQVQTAPATNDIYA